VRRRLRGFWPLDAPHLIDLEIASTFRRLEAAGRVSSRRALVALDDLTALPLERHPAATLLPRIWQLRRILTAYDASYVALAEALDVPLLTTDARLARAHGHGARVELVHA